MNTLLREGQPVVVVGVESDFAPDILDSIARIGAMLKGTVSLGEREWDFSGVEPFQADDIPEWLRREPHFVSRNNPGLRKQRVLRAEELGFQHMLSVVDPTAVVSGLSRIGHGVFVNAGAVVGAQSSIGNNVFINRLAGIGHHVVLGDYATRVLLPK